MFGLHTTIYSMEVDKELSVGKLAIILLINYFMWGLSFEEVERLSLKVKSFGLESVPLR